MLPLTQLLLASSAGLLLASAGCSFVPKSKLEAAQSQNRTLAEQNHSQLAEIENLKVHTRSVEDQLIKAEQELARADQDRGKDRQRLANLRREREQLGDLRPDPSIVPAELSGRIEDLARRYPSLQYDAQTGISKLDTDVLFDSGSTDLKPGSERVLKELAAILQSPTANNLKIMVVGHTDSRGIKGRELREKYPDNWHLSTGRALAVAEQLKAAGLSEERMGVSGFGPSQPVSPNDTADARQRNRRVEIFVVGPETPVVGWTETHGSVYR
jgi:chemotaxis protein MotB